MTLSKLEPSVICEIKEGEIKEIKIKTDKNFIVLECSKSTINPSILQEKRAIIWMKLKENIW